MEEVKQWVSLRIYAENCASLWGIDKWSGKYNSEVEKSANDVKLLHIVTCKTEAEELQKNLSKLSEWVIKWQMKFNTGKCQVMQEGRNNSKYTWWALN